MIYPDIVSTVFCIQFWIGHYRMKKQQFDLSHQEIEQEEKKKLQLSLPRRRRMRGLHGTSYSRPQKS
jgi:hypothetical protein